MDIVGRRVCTNKKQFNPASLNDRIVIQSKTSSADSFGQPIYTWSDFAKVSANVLFTTGKRFNEISQEMVLSNKEMAESVASIRIRYRLDITTQMRVVFRGNNYNIRAILPDSNREYVDLAVSTGLNNG